MRAYIHTYIDICMWSCTVSGKEECFRPVCTYTYTVGTFYTVLPLAHSISADTVRQW